MRFATTRFRRRPTVITVKAISEMRPSPQIIRTRVKPLSPEQWRLGLAIDCRIGSRRQVQGEAHRVASLIPIIASGLGGIDILDDATQPPQQ
jgi:hypothetical protein